MTDISVALPRPKIPVWRTAYEGYRLGIGAIFSSGVMFRFFVYGSVALLAVFGVLAYGNASISSLMANAGTGTNQTLVIGSSFLFGMLLYALIAAIQTPLGVAIQRYVLLGDSPKHSYFAYLNRGYGLRFFRVSIAVYAYFYIAGLLWFPIVYLAYHVSPLDQTEFSAALVANPSALTVIMLVWFISYAVASLLATRTSFAFAIAAVERPGPTIRQGFAETRNTMWRLFFVFFLIFVPPFLVYMATAFAAIISIAAQPSGQALPTSDDVERLAMSSFLSPQIIAATILTWIAIMLSYVALAAGAARAYQIRIERGMSGIAEVFS